MFYTLKSKLKFRKDTLKVFKVLNQNTFVFKELYSNKLIFCVTCFKAHTILSSTVIFTDISLAIRKFNKTI